MVGYSNSRHVDYDRFRTSDVIFISKSFKPAMDAYKACFCSLLDCLPFQNSTFNVSACEWQVKMDILTFAVME